MSALKPYDCIIIGGGPAGLTGALYLARFRRRVLVIDNACSRASLIPCSHNLPGFVEGISGAALLLRMKQQLKPYGVDLLQASVDGLERNSEGVFAAEGRDFVCRAPKLLLATGTDDITPDIPRVQEMILKGQLRLCPICDAYEVVDKDVAVVGSTLHAAKQSVFMRNFSPRVTLFSLGSSPEQILKGCPELKAHGVKILASTIVEVKANRDLVSVTTEDKQVFTYEAVYIALGEKARNRLALALGAECDHGRLLVNEHQESSVPGLYAAGDNVRGLNQICVAMAEAAIAATDIHNSLRQ